jgi:hypothetical protein
MKEAAMPKNAENHPESGIYTARKKDPLFMRVYTVDWGQVAKGHC